LEAVWGCETESLRFSYGDWDLEEHKADLAF
jgi:hypothetical protein